jgi:hypothetical protein
MAKKSRQRREGKIGERTTRHSGALFYGSYDMPVVALHGVKNGCCTLRQSSLRTSWQTPTHETRHSGCNL